eukprot:CAMPEP_0119272032 /NCGR_PEP_ID=MMETSP1329-20130426/8378_1 /TAXON_ID=114041 /ORGANISM="Genus nov. species nov., Strain RCC1024" /LENGTH=387 /DNA_ID=CAMNT_0007272085 /DNA_START=163 /DNA_END=1323 /DNA_ORIENTATION=-
MAMAHTKRGIDAAHEDGLWTCVWTKRGEIVTGGVDELACIWDAQTLEQKHVLKGNLMGVVSVAADATGETLATSSIDNKVRIWGAEAGRLKGTIHAGPVEAWTVDFSNDGASVISGAQRGVVNTWDVETCAKASEFDAFGKDNGFVMSLAHSPTDAHLVAAASVKGRVGIFDSRQKEASTGDFGGHDGGDPIRSLSWTPDGVVLLTACDDGQVKAYDAKKPGEAFFTFYAHPTWVLSVRASPDNVHFATASADRCVKIWNLNTKSRVSWVNRLHTDQIWEVAYSPDGSELCSVADDCHVKFYSVAQHQEELAAEQLILKERTDAEEAARARAAEEAAALEARAARVAREQAEGVASFNSLGGEFIAAAGAPDVIDEDEEAMREMRAE